MLPKTSIHINPKFRKVHINPSFLGKPIIEKAVVAPPTQIYINPRFLRHHPHADKVSQLLTSNDLVNHELSFLQSNDQFTQRLQEPLADTSTPTRKKIIVRNSIKLPPSPSTHAKPLIKIGMRKLIRIGSQATKPTNIEKTAPKIRKPILTKYKIVKEQNAYKIDRRSVKCKRSVDLIAATATKKLLLSSIRRTWINESLAATKVIRSEHIPFVASSSRPSNCLSINGIIYKSSKLKLRKTNVTSPKATASAASKFVPAYRRLTVRGENFLLDANGKNVIRLGDTQSPYATDTAIKRIDIGRITFVQKSNNTFERTDYHKNRFHLNAAKQRSINLLTSKLAKSNVPCLIYRKLGKCAAFDRGKCSKLHDPKQVDICPKYLKGACDIVNCLLSHNVTLSKMPTCKFYLLGMCGKNDCPYLHKKVTAKTSICIDFLKGYCERAAECSKRHEFLCPEFESKGECKVTRCPYPHRNHESRTSKTKLTKRKHKTSTGIRAVERRVDTDAHTEDINSKRYFVESSDQSQSKSNEKIDSSPSDRCDETIIVVRKPMVGALPSYIPLG